MSEKVFVPVLLGTNRKGRASENAANFVVSEIAKRDDIETELVDVREFDLPDDSYTGGSAKFDEYKNVMTRADGLIIITPEYNHGYPGILKTIFDALHDEYYYKVAGFVGVSSGPWGGVRAIEQLSPVVREVRMFATRVDLQFPFARDQFDEDGKVKDDAYDERCKNFLDEIVKVGRILKEGRKILRT